MVYYSYDKGKQNKLSSIRVKQASERIPLRGRYQWADQSNPPAEQSAKNYVKGCVSDVPG